MSVSPSYPGLYIQELPSSAHAIVPAPTSIAAFVGYSHPFKTKNFNVAQQLFSFSDYEANFGPLFSSGLVDASLPRAVYQFFLNGGSNAYVVGLQPGLFDGTNAIVTRLGAANGGATVSATAATTSGGASAGVAFAIDSSNHVPAISSLLPASVAPGSGTFTLTVNGSNFEATSVVNWNGVPLPSPTLVNSAQITVSVDQANVVNSGTASVMVHNPGGGDSAAMIFAIDAGPVPTISSLSPAGVLPPSPGFTLTVNGSNFVSTSIVNWNGAPLATSFVNASQLAASVPAANVAKAGAVSVTVDNQIPGGGESAAASFVVGATPLPTISSLLPASVASAVDPFTLLVNGSNFVPTSVVKWNGVALPTTYVNAFELAASVSAPGPATVTVESPPSAGTGIVFTALELTDVVPMHVTITNVRNGGATFDAAITYGSQVETFRGVQLAGTAAQLPDKMINGISALVQVSQAAGGWGTAIANQQISVSYAVPSNVSTGFSASDFTVGDGSTIAVLEANSSLDKLEIFNLLLVPGVTDFSVISAALAFAERKRAFAIVDPPPQAPAFGSSSDSPQPIQYWMEGLGGTGPSLPRSQNGALYFPYLFSTDPVTGNNVPMAPSGFVAGVYAATDSARGVWKAPACLAAVVLNTSGPVASGAMNDPQQGVLNLDAINCLRSFHGVGTVVWGARTLVASNQAYQQSMYVPLRRMTLFIEQTLLANLRWVVFEPNDEPLWTAIKASIEAFLLSLFRQGGLQGSTPSEAFQVKCDATTTTPTDQQNGIVNIVVGFAPLKLAEFVIIKIAQLAGQTAGA